MGPWLASSHAHMNVSKFAKNVHSRISSCIRVTNQGKRNGDLRAHCKLLSGGIMKLEAAKLIEPILRFGQPM